MSEDLVVDGQVPSVCFYPLLFSGMLPEAVLPPSKEHSYAQWLERTYQLKNSRDPQTGKTESLVTSQQTPSLKLLGMDVITICFVAH